MVASRCCCCGWVCYCNPSRRCWSYFDGENSYQVPLSSPQSALCIQKQREVWTNTIPQKNDNGESPVPKPQEQSHVKPSTGCLRRRERIMWRGMTLQPNNTIWDGIALYGPNMHLTSHLLLCLTDSLCTVAILHFIRETHSHLTEREKREKEQRLWSWLVHLRET